MRRLLFLAIALALLLPVAAVTAQTIHTVQPGQTLYSIGLRYGLTVAEILAANPSLNPNVIHSGNQLVIPVPGQPAPAPAPAPQPGQPTTEVQHTVAVGEYLGLIAERYDVLVADILRRNSIANPDLVYPGTVLIIPGVTVEAAPVPAVPAPGQAPQPAGEVRHTVAPGEYLGLIAESVTACSSLTSCAATTSPTRILSIPAPCSSSRAWRPRRLPRRRRRMRHPRPLARPPSAVALRLAVRRSALPGHITCTRRA